MQEVSLAAAFAAGLVSFASPCVLVLLPVYLAFLGETAAEPLPASRGTPPAGSPAVDAKARRPATPGASVLPQALLFVLGFTAVFVLLGTSIGLLGGALFRVDAIRQLAGVAVMVMGLLATGVFGDVFGRLPSGVHAELLPAARSLRSITLGAMVSVGWTPCIGPVLGAILSMGAASGSAPIAALLLVAYSAGLATPFLGAALGLPRLSGLVGWMRRQHRPIRLVSGLFVMAIGLLIYLNAFARLATLFVWPL